MYMYMYMCIYIYGHQLTSAMVCQLIFLRPLDLADASTDLDRVLNELLKRSPETKCIWRRMTDGAWPSVSELVVA